MLIGIRTNRTEYCNDIAEEIRLFYPLAEVLFSEDDTPVDAMLCVTLTETAKLTYALRASFGAGSIEYTFVVPDGRALTVKKHEKRQIKLAAYRLLREACKEVVPPWGSLTGIRPTKLFRELTNESGIDEARRVFRETFDVSEEKIELAETICQVQKPYIDSVETDAFGVYVGIPFCRTRCLYCSFASEVTRNDDTLVRYLAALKRDISDGAGMMRERRAKLRSLYIGGGTPTVLTAEQLDGLIDFTLSAYGGYGLEFTVEAGRPDTITPEKLAVMRKHGVTRISINPQTMNDKTLKCIGRAHSSEETVRAYETARELGFDFINMDVIAGLPGETADDMRRTYDRIIALRPDNLTVHALAIKRSSLLKKQLDDYPLPDVSEASQMVADGYEAARAMGMVPYYMYRQKYMTGNLENVGYARRDRIGIYNIDMMEETTSILSHGAGSMTKRVFGNENRIERLASPKDVPTYQDKLDVLFAAKRKLFSD